MRTLITATLIAWITLPSAAQIEYPTEGCMIRYPYDAAGNRIQRDWYCWDDDPVEMPTEPAGAADANAAKRALADVHMNVYPNPANDLATVTFTADVPGGTLELLDGAGRQVLSTTVTGTTTELRLAQVEQGSYWLVYRMGQERIVTGLSVGGRTNTE